MERFCIFPEHAPQIAERQVCEACERASHLATIVNRLHKFIGAYPVDAMSSARLDRLKEELIDLTIKVDEILAANAPAPVLMAAE